jgi:lipopolysaccharide transport system ATP-binding protein
VTRDGNPEMVLDYYNSLISQKNKSKTNIKLRKKTQNGKIQISSGTGEAKIENITLHNSKGAIADVINVNELVELHVKVKVFKELDTLVMGYGIKDNHGKLMYGINTWYTKQVIKKPIVGSEYLIKVAFNANLGVGSYSIQIALHDRESHLTANYDWRDLALLFNVINVEENFSLGCNWMKPKINILEL